MRHRTRARKLGRTTSHRLAMFRNLVTSLLDHERVETTDAKAKEIRRIADRMITLGKRGDLHARRRALRIIRERDVAAKVFGELADRYRNRPGGYTRVLKTRVRPGDAAALSIVELVEGPAAPAEAGKKASGKKASAKKSPARKASEKKAPAEKKAARASAKTAGGKKAGAKKKAPAAKAAGRKKASRKRGD